MAWKENYYDELISKIDQFTRKFYINKLIRGSLYFVGLLTVVFLTYNLLENQFYFNRSVRSALSLSYLALFGFSFTKWIALPLLHYFRLGRLISHEEAARIIGTHFTDVQDKLLNVLQLKSQSLNYSDRSLIDASIAQKSMELHPVPFIQAVDLQRNRKYLHYAIAPLFLLLSLLVFAPGMIKKPTQRLIQINKDFEKEAPFRFAIDASSLKVEQNGNYTLHVRTEGSAMPAEVFVDADHYQYKLRKEGPEEFSYTFSNVQKDLPFTLFSGDVRSQEYLLQVMMKPLIESFEVHLEYPAYTGKKAETLNNLGDLLIPTGTKVHWNFKAAFTKSMLMRLEAESSPVPLTQRGESEFQYTAKFTKSGSYTLFLNNLDMTRTDSVNYQVQLIEDQFPQIQVETFSDSTDYKMSYFSGELSDDYGIRNLSFNYQINTADGKVKESKSIPVPTSNPGKFSNFRYVFNAADYDVKPGEAINYYFEVWDNDAVNGSKSARSQIQQYREASAEELAMMESKNNEDIKDNLQSALTEARKLQEKLDDFKNKMRQKKDLEWQNKKDLEKMLDQQNKLQQKLDEAKKKLDENLKKQKTDDETLRDKQEQLQKLFNETASPEMKQLMKQIQDLMSELNKEQTLKMTEQFQDKNMDLTKEMDRLLELFKQLELEKNVRDQIKDLKELSQKQDALSEKTEKDSLKNESLEKQQDEINKKFDELSKKQDALKKKNEELKTPRKLENRKQQTEDIKKDLKDAKDELSKPSDSNNSKSNKSKASKKQKDASKKMEEMADQMESEMQESEQEQAEIDAKMLRQLLENLVALSFDQERVVNELSNVNSQTPRFLNLVQDQFRIKDNFKIVEDSLDVLSKRIVEIQSFVMDKVTEINDNFKQGMDLLEERRTPEASNNQRRVMKGMNDLAVMLSESLDQKQKECKSGSCKKPGNKSCNNPNSSGAGKSGKKPSDKITQGMKGMEKEMQDQLAKMKNGQQGTSKEFAEMAAKQAKLRKMLEDLEQDRKQSGNGSKEAQEAIDEMNKLEKQLVNKQLTNEMLKRQQEITTRLLESERAERERDWDDQRKSEVGTNIERKFPPSLEEYIKQRQGETEWFKQISPDLRPFYKKLVEQYYQSLKKQG